MTWGLDTSVILRLLGGEPKAQCLAALRRVRREIEAGHSLAVTPIVALEAYHALRTYYGLSPEEARSKLHQVVSSGGVVPMPLAQLEALSDGASGPGVADRLVQAQHESLGIGTLTFDRAFAKLPGVEFIGS